MNRERISLFQLQTGPQGDLLDQNGKTFDARQYSRYKYGERKAAKNYGYRLADLVAAQYKELMADSSRLVVTAVPSRSIPIGADAVADAMFNRLNYHLFLQDKEPAQRVKITRNSIPEGDYATLSEAERAAIMENESFSVDPRVAGSNMLIVDDISITGQSAEAIAQYLDTCGLMSAWYMYVAALHVDDAQANPQIEAQLNHAFVNNLSALSGIIATREYILNQRVCKFILSYQNFEELSSFLFSVDIRFLEDLYAAIVNDGLISKPSYQPVVALLTEEMRHRHLL